MATSSKGQTRDTNGMDEAAAEARTEIQRNMTSWKASDVAAWWKSWYRRAGHKRLGRILVELAG